jgi:hypothetical protein
MSDSNTTLRINGSDIDWEDLNLGFDDSDLAHPDGDEWPRRTRRQIRISTETDMDRLMSKLDTIETKLDRLLDELND